MKKILGILAGILAIGIIAYVFINNTSNEAEDENNSGDNNVTAPKEELDDGNSVDTSLQFSLEANGDAGEAYIYKVRNEGEEMETLSFTTSQRFEYEISDGNEVVNKYSSDKAFMQVLEDITIEPGEELTFDVPLPDLEPGEYTITIFLTAKNLASASKVTETFEVN